MNTRIIVDSTADLVPEYQNCVHVVPMTVRFGDEEFIDGVTIDSKMFYEKLIESDVLPTTSQAAPDAFATEYEKAKQAGEAAVVITVSSGFSGTYQSACIAAADYENIYVVDGGSAAMGTGILVELAVKMLREGRSAAEIAEALDVSLDYLMGISGFPAPIKTLSTEESLMLSAFGRASARDRKIIFGVLEDHMTAEELENYKNLKKE